MYQCAEGVQPVKLTDLPAGASVYAVSGHMGSLTCDGTRFFVAVVLFTNSNTTSQPCIFRSCEVI